MSNSNQLQLANDFKINANDYANQANAILGIREAGKTYTAMKAAEQLLENNIPIIAFDPVGVWKNLKIGNGKHKGYNIVIAGGKGSDIVITKENAVDVVRAAMIENVSLVIDLYSPELINKSTWIAIVQSTVDLLMYENKEHGLRHIFIEEAAEFIPQRLQPQHSKVYASLERLARMGRNARLGMSIINQRAEEVNKAILEICELSLIHRQVGKNSMLSIQKWLEVRQLKNVKEIIGSLPMLNKGECWAIGNSDDPQKIQVTSKNTFHPDPKGKHTADGLNVKDVSLLVDKIQKHLKKELPPKDLQFKTDSKQVRELQEMIGKLKTENVGLHSTVASLKIIADSYRSILLKIKILIPDVFALNEENGIGISANNSHKVQKIAEKRQINSKSVIESVRSVINDSATTMLQKCPLAILQFLATYKDRSFTNAQIGIMTNYSPSSGGFNNALSILNSNGLIVKSNGRIKVNDIPNLETWTGVLPSVTYSLETFKNKLTKCEREIYDVLLNNKKRAFSKEVLAHATQTMYSPTSGGFNNAIGRLKTLELVVRTNGLIQLNPELLELG